MRLLQTEITPLINDFMHVDLRSQSFLVSPFHAQPSFHAHPELELVFILEGYGKRIIGNKVENFEAGDMVFIGSYVPHVWLSDPAFYEKESKLQSKVLVTYFNPKVFNQIFESMKEFEPIRELIGHASKGIKIQGETRNLIADKLLELATKSGFEKVDGLLQIMHLISISNDKSYIVNDEAPTLSHSQTDRLIEVIKYIKENLHNPISLKQVANIACMKEQSFCRYFKGRTQKSFSQYVEHMRMELARKLLIDFERSITDVAYSCGYNSSSHFCKIFKQHNGLSPYQYKSNIKNGFKPIEQE
jgi:AraC-like DNA-binding protein